MVISCPECSTRFRVDENKIPERGAKIRCARCKHIFAVAAPAPEPAGFIPEPVSVPEEPPAWEAPTPPTEDSSSFESLTADSQIPPQASPQEPDPGNIRGDDFGFDGFDSPEIGGGTNDELDPSTLGNMDQEEDDTSDFAFGEEYGNVSLGEDDDSATAETPFSFGDPISAPPHNKVEADLPDFNLSPPPKTAVPTPDPLADSFTEDPSLDAIPPVGEDEFNFGAPETPAQVKVPKASSRGPLSVVILIILMLILAIIIAGGVLVWKSGPEGLEKVLSVIANRGSATEVKGDIRLANLQGSFITNRKEGELFVIQGVAINDLKEAQAAIQVKGVIFDKDGKQLMQKTIFCGNPISDNELRTLPYSKMEELMGNQFGESLANLNVTRGQSIPFTIVFRKLPKTLSEFVVEVADSKPAAQ